MKIYSFNPQVFTRNGLFMLCLVISFSAVSAQSLTDNIGGTSTDFNFYYGDSKLDVQDQIILKRGLSNYAVNEIPAWDEASAYGYGLQTFRLEFLSTDIININSNSVRHNIRLDLLDENNTSLLSFMIPSNDFWVFSSNTESHVYSINLQNLPLVIFNKTKNIKINIVK